MATPHTIAVAGKGGVGKTTTCGMLIDYLCKKKMVLYWWWMRMPTATSTRCWAWKWKPLSVPSVRKWLRPS